LHWTPDVVPVAQVERFFDTFSLVDPNIPYVRLGGPGDGGYVLPDDLDGLVGCLSPGVADRADFEAAMLSREVPCHLMDASVAGPPMDHQLISFRPEFLGGVERPGWTTLQRWVDADCPPNGDLILQMDIEGHEWQVLASTPTLVLRRFRMLILELHDLHLLATKSGLNRVEEVFHRLNQQFVLVNVHPNNYEFPVVYGTLELHPVVEATWLRRDRVREMSPGLLRHALEASNDPELPDFELDPRWA